MNTTLVDAGLTFREIVVNHPLPKGTIGIGGPLNRGLRTALALGRTAVLELRCG